jgi:hypothetical protein
MVIKIKRTLWIAYGRQGHGMTEHKRNLSLIVL